MSTALRNYLTNVSAQMPVLTATGQPVAIPNLINAPIPGDYNNDSVVNAADYDLWKSELGSLTHLAADGSGNGIVDTADFVVWRNFFTGGSGSGSSLGGGGVPEPTAACFFLIAVYTAAAAFPRRLRRAV
jgi:hypothetical protein